MSSWQEKVGFWLMDELIHHPSSIIHDKNFFAYSKEVSFESYNSDKIYHTTLNIIFSVDIGSPIH